MYARTLLPRDKSDTSGIDTLKQLPEEDIKPVIPELLTWLQDYNWPVAAPVTDVLAHFGDIVEPYLMPLLSPENRDEVWKYWIIEKMLPRLPGEPSNRLVNAVKRIAQDPTAGEHMENVDEAAQAYLAVRSDAVALN